MASRLFLRNINRQTSFFSAPLFYSSVRFKTEYTFTFKDFGAESISEGTLNWSKKVGDYVEEDEEVCTIETSKATVFPNSPNSGVLLKLLKEDGATVEAGDDLWVIDTDASPPEESEPAPEETKKEPAKEQTKSEDKPKEKAKPKETKPQAPPKKAVTHEGSETRVSMDRMRQAIAKNLKDAQNTAAMLTTFQECDMYNLMKLRSEYKDLFLDTHGVKLGFMSGFVKASAQALMKHRNVNGYIDGDEIVYKDYVDINVAVATPKGLVTPVIRDCDKMSFADIEQEIGTLADKARKNRISLGDLQSGTFTISNGGVYGSMMGTPIINGTQSAILGMHAITKRAVVINDEIVIRPMMYLALTYDHRLLDGKDAVTFLRSIKENVEDPRRLVLDL